jgi:hypothetical protein
MTVRRLADYLTPITSGLTPCPPDIGRLSQLRAAELAARLRKLETARREALIASRDYYVT